MSAVGDILQSLELNMTLLTHARLSVALLLTSGLLPAADAANLHQASEEVKARALASYTQLPLSFEENRGQADSRVRFLSRGNGY